MVPEGVEGTVEWIYEGMANIVQPIAGIKNSQGQVVEIPMVQRPLFV